MKVVCGYDPGEPLRARFAGWTDEEARVVVSPEEYGAKFTSDLRDAEVLLHILSLRFKHEEFCDGLYVHRKNPFARCLRALRRSF
jgi:hypothetical protein